tara:strand:- start:178 stop:336 length:159 start_codon:yes stop_codon:yes gene_type:complete
MDLSITMEKTRFGVEAFAYKDQENNISGVGFFPAYPSTLRHGYHLGLAEIVQ